MILQINSIPLRCNWQIGSPLIIAISGTLQLFIVLLQQRQLQNKRASDSQIALYSYRTPVKLHQMLDYR
ncbi:hypothetical protein D3C80_1620760 [compost metagenome]